MVLVVFSRQVMSDSVQPHGLQHTRLPCPLPSPRVCSNASPLSRWCCLTTSSSVTSFFCLQSSPLSGSFPVSWLFASSRQNIWSFSVRPSSDYSGLILLFINSNNQVFQKKHLWKFERYSFLVIQYSAYNWNTWTMCMI